jgi:hypothetical protein
MASTAKRALGQAKLLVIESTARPVMTVAKPGFDLEVLAASMLSPEVMAMLQNPPGDAEGFGI